MSKNPTKRLRTSQNFVLQGSDKERPNGISLTVPDMTPNLRDMINKRAAGIPYGTTFNHGYSDEDLPEVYKMDEVELLQFRLDNAQKIEQLLDEQHKAAKALEEYHSNREKAIKESQKPKADTAA